MAKAFGKPIQVDNTTLAMNYGFFASVIVEVDFANKIPNRVWVGEGDNDDEEGFWQCAEIPKVPKFCSYCKIVGHLLCECRARLKEVSKDMERYHCSRRKEEDLGRAKKHFQLKKFNMGVVMNVHPVVEVASASSADPSIPPSFETHNRFHGFEQEEDVATSQLVLENSEKSIIKPSSEPIIGSKKILSLKSKVRGMFPNDTLSIKKKEVTKSRDPNNVSADKLMELGSSWGLDFPPLRSHREEMFSDLEKNHDSP